MNIYWKVLILTAGLALLLKNHKKEFIIAASMVHVFVCGLRASDMHGDLLKYKYEFQTIQTYGWTSSDLLKGGRNTLFYVFNKIVGVISNGNFQVMLFLIALTSTVAIGYVIYRYSPMPFVSYVMWNCFGFYLFSFYSIKQTLAMAVLMFAVIGIYEDDPKKFYGFTLIAGLIHFPAFVFLPAYLITKIRTKEMILFFYATAFILLYRYHDTIVEYMSDLYYEGETFGDATGMISGKTMMMIALLVAGYLLCGFSVELFRKTFLFIAIASLLQMFSMYGNVFTRLADYYYQFVILYIPFMLSQIHREGYDPPIYLTNNSLKVVVTIFLCFAVVFYYYSNMKNATMPSSDNLILNFRFMWQ